MTIEKKNNLLKIEWIYRLLLLIMIFEIPYMYLYLVVALFLLLINITFNKGRLCIGLAEISLIFFIIFYFVFDSCLEYSVTYKIWYSISTISMYISGRYMKFNKLDKVECSVKLEKTIKFIAFSYLALTSISLIRSFITGQYMISRNPIDIWKNIERPATHFGNMLIPSLAYGIKLVLVEKKGKLKSLGIMLVILNVAFSLVLGSRTLLYLVPLGFVVGYFVNILIKGTFSRKNFNQFVMCICLVLGLIVMWELNIFNFRSIILNTQMGQRFLQGTAPTLQEDGRYQAVSFFFEHIKESLWGGGYSRLHIRNLHNVYLNVFDLSGIIPFILLIVFTICVIYDMKKIVSNVHVSNNFKLFLLLLFMLVFVQMMLEPMMESVPVFFWCILYIAGMVRSYRVQIDK